MIKEIKSVGISFTDLEVWRLARQIIVKTYKLLDAFPLEEKYGIVSQSKDSVISIAANIAEGFGRFYFKDKIKFYYNARGSLEETTSHLLIANDLGFINDKNFAFYQEIIKDLDRLAVKLNNFIKSAYRQLNDDK